MPHFELIPLAEATLKSATGRRAEITNEYAGYIGRLAEGQAGRLSPAQGETLATVRRRLGTAKRALGKDLVIKRAGDYVYFWVQPAGAKRGRRPRRKPAVS